MKLTADFYTQPATEAAKKLCGKLFCTKDKDGTVRKYRITETECYYGEEDTACHAHKGRTPRTETLYRNGGILYVYLCYGIHNLMNIITGPEGHPEGVLIRGLEGYNGPGKLTKALGVTRDHNSISLTESDLFWCEDDDFTPEITASPRVGIDYAEEADRLRPWRFTVKK